MAAEVGHFAAAAAKAAEAGAPMFDDNATAGFDTGQSNDARQPGTHCGVRNARAALMRDAEFLSATTRRTSRFRRQAVDEMLALNHGETGQSIGTGAAVPRDRAYRATGHNGGAAREAY